MNLEDFIRPGIFNGLYPEKKFKDNGWIEGFIATLINAISSRLPFQKIRYRRIIQQVSFFGKQIDRMDSDEIYDLIQLLRGHLLSEGFKKELVTRSFALIREISHRHLGMRHYDVQIIGGWVMLNGFIAEMETGEGKTLTATLPACTAALAGVPVHIVTVNDYLAQRDAEQMEPIYRQLGLTVGIIVEGMDSASRILAYGCDITYCTNKQLAFDYLRDRLVFAKQPSKIQMQIERFYDHKSRLDQLFLRGLCYVIIDEADSVLIDESRTPLIISKEGDDLNFQRVAQDAIQLSEQLIETEHFMIDRKDRKIELSESGENRIREITQPMGGLWKGYQRSFELINQALAARYLFILDKHYLVTDGKVQIIDEYTGRIMADRSWEYGLHQMVEAKEGCAVTSQKETLAKISYQQFFRRYLRISGMTGTAKEVSGELWSVYRLNVISVPTNKPICRKEIQTQVYKTAVLKWQAIVDRIKLINKSGRPILVGTRSVEASENLSQLLFEHGLQHQVLNARQNQQEAEIIKLAGQYGQITVATNMAGRGTDIKLSSEVEQIGGLHVIATECHEARRIDRQLFGRCGRQGDRGSYEMIVSIEDELVNNYCPALLCSLLVFFGFLGNRFFRILSTHLIFKIAQMKAEKHHELQRRNLLKMDSRLKSLLAFSGSRE